MTVIVASREPNAFVTGVAKAGTTSLTRYLAQHPDVFVPVDWEPNHYVALTGGLTASGPTHPEIVRELYLSSSTVDEDAFAALYAGAGTAPVRIDGSVRYLYHHDALAEIARRTPDARHVVVLRDPVERLVSHWRMNRRFQLEPLDLEDALAAEDDRVAAGWGYDWHYRRVSTYAPQLEALYRLFPTEQVLVIGYGDLLREPVTVLEACCRFLDVDPTHAFDISHRSMVAAEVRWRWLDRRLDRPGVVHRGLHRLPDDIRYRITGFVAAHNTREPRPLPAGILAAARDWFVADVEATARILDLDPQSLRSTMSSRCDSVSAEGDPR